MLKRSTICDIGDVHKGSLRTSKNFKFLNNKKDEPPKKLICIHKMSKIFIHNNVMVLGEVSGVGRPTGISLKHDISYFFIKLIFLIFEQLR